MWIEAILAREDFVRIVDQLLPLTIALGTNGDHLKLHEPSEVALVPDQGIRLRCKASVRYTVVGIAVPVVLHTVKVLLRPELVKREGQRDALVFSFVVEDADLAGIPTVIDNKIRDKVNAVMKTKRVAFSWEFGDMLTQTVKLPKTLQPLESMSLEVAWGKFKVTDEAFVMAISFHSSVSRHAKTPLPMPVPAALTAPLATETAMTTTSANGSIDAAPLLLGGAVMALAIGGAYGAMRVTTPSSRRNGSLLTKIATVAITAGVVAVGGQVATQLVRSLFGRRVQNST